MRLIETRNFHRLRPFNAALRGLSSRGDMKGQAVGGKYWRRIDLTRDRYQPQAVTRSMSDYSPRPPFFGFQPPREVSLEPFSRQLARTPQAKHA